jgi:hypothetical protein
MKPRPPCNHADPSTWHDAPAPGRKGWIKTTCQRCGGFLGYRPESPAKQSKKLERSEDALRSP